MIDLIKFCTQDRHHAGWTITVLIFGYYGLKGLIVAARGKSE